jgi:hypothetical protein
MKLISRIKSVTPPRDKQKRDLLGTLGVICGAILATGVVLNPIGIAALTVAAIAFGGKSVYHAQKVLK